MTDLVEYKKPEEGVIDDTLHFDEIKIIPNNSKDDLAAHNLEMYLNVQRMSQYPKARELYTCPHGATLDLGEVERCAQCQEQILALTGV